MKKHADTIIFNAGTVLTLAGPDRPRKGLEMEELAPILDGAVAVHAGRILTVGPTAKILADYTAAEQIDAAGKLLMPGFVDPHTHLVFAGTRENEMARKIAGESYLDILKSGGGIHSTVAAVRQADEAELVRLGRNRLDQLAAHGTTTVEIKSGYGLSPAAEEKMLRVINRLALTHPLDIVPTFLGAHVFPRDMARRDYLDWLTGDALNMARPLARFVDVFCEEEAFTVTETREILQAARKAGFGLKAHVGQFHALGGAAVAAELGAVSVDHCDQLSDDELDRMRQFQTIAVLLPGASFFAGSKQFPDVNRLRTADIPVALATDFNPGSCPSFSMPMMISLACLHLKMSPAAAICAATSNAAWAIDMGTEIGTLQPGKKADMILLDIRNPEQLPYFFGTNLVCQVWKSGRKIFEQGQITTFG